MQKWAKFSKRYSKIDPQMLLKKWSLNVTQKVIHKRYSKSDPQTLLKNWPRGVTQKLTHKRYAKIDPQLLLKIGARLLLYNWPTTVTQKVIHKRSSFVAQLLTFSCISVFSLLFPFVIDLSSSFLFSGLVFLIFCVVSLTSKFCI